MAHGLSCSAACGIFLDQVLNLHLLHWQVDSLSLSHRKAPAGRFFTDGATREALLAILVSYKAVSSNFKALQSQLRDIVQMSILVQKRWDEPRCYILTSFW